jgi:PKD repeat protein
MKRILACASLFAFIAVVVCGMAFAVPTKCGSYTFDGTKSKAHGYGKLTYRWDLGDGSTAEGPVVTHTYDKAGEYTVKLTVTDESGLPCDTGLSSQTVKVNTPPKAVFNGPDTACTGSELTFDAGSSSSDTSRDLSYRWTFGDGTSAEGARVTKTFTKGGIYKVQLIVDDNLGTECSTECAYLNVKVNTPPVANAGGKDIVMTCIRPGSEYGVTFNGSGSDADGDKLSYSWNFGDGSSAEGARVTHVYEKGGTYKATLIVDDGSGSSCSTASDTVNVTLSKAPQADAGKAAEACVGSEIAFDGSGSVAESGATYTWDFGDGTSATGPRVSHSYSKGGRYSAMLTVDNGECRSVDGVAVSVNAPPTATLTGPDRACVGDRVIFDASGSSDPEGDRLTYTWDFGDGELMQLSSKECRVYERGGTFTVKVMVDDGKGTSCSTAYATTVIKVNSRPVAAIGKCDACCVGVETTFDGTASSDPDGDRLEYTWDFGDGATATGAKVTHAYSAPGNYKVMLKVDDGQGTDCSVSYASYEARIHVNPEAVISVR